MKFKIHSIFVLLIITCFLWMGCDRVDEPMTVTDEEIPIITDTVFVIDSVIVTQKQVLLEDFTGHKCVNCPEAAITAHEWAEDFNHKLIICTVHAGFYAETEQTGLYTYDFRCPTGDDIFNYFGQPFNPSGTVNRVEYNGNQVLIFLYPGNDWSQAIATEMSKPNAIDIKLLNKYFPNSNSVQINVASTVKMPLEGKYKMVVLILEDLIIKPQKNNNGELGPEPDWVDYHHRNVLRDAVTPLTFGSYVYGDGSLTEGQTYYNQFYYELDKPWVSDTADYNIITYIYDEANYTILQVAELGIKME